ncbi:hypothetical protein Agub_g4684 [Astrephomene gubernaculifera]|uniref:Uncharacterized protein n=1 Tax=Astrephomene gubernaculifera TaxID=47775 RepID=A0AAD3DN90_9CHLO|nr:hypothetical protein Agub_g4684 [Astrephomene gubernaculifera]
MAATGGAAPATDASRPSTSGNANAKKCLEDFFGRLEATVRKRLRVKLGGVQTVDWSKLSAALSAATPKIKPPILPSSRTWRTDLAVEMKPEIKQQLREVFIRYCGWGDKQNFMFISRSQFIRFVRDMGMWNDEIDALGLSGLFDKILLGSLDPGAASRLALSDFILAVTGLGTKLCPSSSVQASFDQVVNRFILPHVHQPLPDPDPIDSALLHMDIVATLERLRPKLTVLWDTYIQQQQGGSGHDSPSTSLSGSPIPEPRAEITLNSFLRLASDFEVTAVVLSKVQLIHSFKRSKFGAPPEPIDSNVHTKIRLSFQEFLDCIARCAMLAFDYKPPPTVVPTLDFKDCYRTTAKQLWLHETAGGSAKFGGNNDDESEVEMPAAVNYAIGNEDWPQYDEVMSRAPSMRITHSAGVGGTSIGRDRLISRAVSIAQGRTRTQGADGMEMMLIHSEPSTMLQKASKPVHLQEFSCDWVGRPGLTLSETGKLRKRVTDPWITSGLYHTQVGVDPRFEQHAADMQMARLVREQHMEALQLHYQAARRLQIRETTRKAAGRRQELELQAGQTLARVMESGGASTSGSPGTAYRSRRSGPAEGGGAGGGGRSGSAPAGGRQDCGGCIVMGLEEVLSRTEGRGADAAGPGRGGAAAGRSKTLMEELSAALDVESKLPHASIAGHGQIRFG